MTPVRLGLWIVLAVAQLCVPAWMIVGHERVLREGRQLKLHTRPVDPADAFRGRYVALSFPVEEVRRPLARGDFAPGDAAYIEFREGADGFAEVAALHKEQPDAELLLKVNVQYLNDEMVRVELPFTRFYMDEYAAPAAEKAYMAQSRDPTEAWVTVRVLRGRGALEQLYLGGKPVREYLREQSGSR